MKRVKYSLLLIVVFMSFNSFSQRNISPVTIDEFWGLKIPSKREDLYGTLKAKGYNDYEISYDKKKGVLNIINPIFAGVDFDTAEFRLFKKLVFYEATFRGVYELSQYDLAMSTFRMLLKTLNAKYGEHNILDDTDNDLYYWWEDANENKIILSIGKGLSNDGGKRGFLNITYSDDKFYNLAVKNRIKEM